MRGIARIVLIGFSAGGKSTVARLLAERLGWLAIDIDEHIIAEFTKSIPEIFAEHGEVEFRTAEQRLLSRALSAERVVIATGGGAVIDPSVWSDDLLRSPGTLVVALDLSPEIVFARLREQSAAEGEDAERPMLAGNDPLARIQSLKSSRQAAYDRADLTLVVDQLSPDEVTAELASIVEGNDGAPNVTLQTPSGASEMFIAPDAVKRLGALMKERWPTANRVWLITDAHVGRLHQESVFEVLRNAGFNFDGFAVPPGETSKSLEGAATLYDWLLSRGIERGDIVVALGGGVIGDLAGFVAATCLRGVGLVQVPTSLLAMVDSSVGGKTGINHRTGKNLIGAFYQPPLVVIDSQFLRTLPPRELASGWAEVIKHGVIQRSTPGGDWNDLLPILERNGKRLRALEEPAFSYVVRRNVALKAAVVEADEREAGIRAYLNFGHTLGHAVEAAGYRYLHGEAIAVGMLAESRISAEFGLFDGKSVDRIEKVVGEFGLPSSADVDRADVLALIGSDKKRTAGKLRWVLPTTGGGVTIRDDVSLSVVESVVNRVVIASTVASE
ncbi:MAG: 3-dehydroquinate synthase [Thermomicrobiales bacterium]